MSDTEEEFFSKYAKNYTEPEVVWLSRIIATAGHRAGAVAIARVVLAAKYRRSGGLANPNKAPARHLRGCVAHDKPRKDCAGCGRLLGPGWWSKEVDTIPERVASMVAQCPLDADMPHKCSTLIAVHDLPILLGLSNPPREATS